MSNQAFSKIWIIVMVVGIVGGGVFAWQWFGGTLKETQKLTEEQIKAVNYNANNPSFEQGKQPDYGFYLIEEGAYYKTPIVWGDLNGDGKEDAIVVLDQGSGGSATAVLIGTVINDNGEPKFIDYKSLGDRTRINNIEIENGIITIDMFVKRPDDAGCCPSWAKKAEYKLFKNKIEEIIPTYEITDWRTYRNEDYGFEMKYPSDVLFPPEQVQDAPVLHSFSTTSIGASPIYDLAVYVNNINISALKDAQNSVKNLPVSIEWSGPREEQIGGTIVYITSAKFSLGLEGVNIKYYFPTFALNFAYANYETEDGFKYIERQMLSTLKFIEVAKQTEKIPEEAKYCKTDTDCACGVHKITRECFYGNKDYVDTTQQCPDFCTGLSGRLMIKCINNECKQVSE